MLSSMMRSIIRLFKKKEPLKEIETSKFPIRLETFGLIECLLNRKRQPTVDTDYGTITYIYEDGTREVFYKGKIVK